VRVLDTREVKDADAISELVPKLIREDDGHRRLTNTSRPAKRDEPASKEVLSHCTDVCIPSNYPGRPRRKDRIWSSIPRARLLGR
jgi:hypothetical protein